MNKLSSFLLVVAACSSSKGADRPDEPQRDPRLAARADAVDKVLLAYRPVLEAGTGQPQADVWRTAVAGVDPSVVTFAHDVLDVVFGFDFVHPAALPEEYCRAPEVALPGNIRAVPDRDQAVQILDEVRAAISVAIRAGDGSLVASLDRGNTPLGVYAPLHTGRCYPHGHVEYEEVYTRALDCITDSLRGLVALQVLEARGDQAPSARTGGCNCYVPADCASPKYTCGNYGRCGLNGKLDGTCYSTGGGFEDFEIVLGAE